MQTPGYVLDCDPLRQVLNIYLVEATPRSLPLILNLWEITYIMKGAPSAAREGYQKVHEYSLTKRMVGIVNEAARQHNAKKVNAVVVVAGEDSGIIPESVQMYFDMIAQGTLAAGARLDLRIVKPQMRCPDCGLTFPRPRFSFDCPRCGALGNPTGIGGEFYVESVELEEEDEPKEPQETGKDLNQ